MEKSNNKKPIPFSSSLPPIEDDAVRPFLIETLHIRGRTVQLNQVINDILNRHQYPEAVSYLLAEVIVLTTLIATSLKFNGRFTLQTQSTGAVDLLVCDFQTPAYIRAYARFNIEKLEQAVKDNHTETAQLLGTGTLSLIIDSDNNKEPYQGIVELTGAPLEEVICQYFAHSEQVPTFIRLSVAKHYDPQHEKGKNQYRAGGIFIQYLPQSDQKSTITESEQDDSWQEAKSLTQTVGKEELIDPDVNVDRLLFRLFHEHDIRIFNPQAIIAECPCSREKIKAILARFPKEDIQACIENKFITVTCEFCSEQYQFNPESFLHDDE